MAGPERRSAEQNADRERMKEMVTKARRKKKRIEDDEEDEDDRPRKRAIGVFGGTYYHAPRLFAFIATAIAVPVMVVLLIALLNQPVPRAKYVVGHTLFLVLLFFILFDILRGGGRDTYWRL
ncbi:hypothetical protein PX52LOC_03023 [Limnoglobus roseus]|uniref:Uncharacterized protein n=2 Tax=Limnoglobus roseus TaxID=2598579 RepID=A0A5C1AG33_9BACT|nr:hypothetical protein PX52LOC_03023 [Limnoglobus roseus]